MLGRRRRERQITGGSASQALVDLATVADVHDQDALFAAFS
jgi:hypothetical protein